MSDPKISVLMAVWAGDRAEWVDAALASLAEQTLLPAEVVVVEDGPIHDDVSRVLDEAAHTVPLRRLHVEVNQGLGFALQLGLTECRFDLVARMDSDDINEPDRLERQAAALAADPSISALGGYVAEFAEDPDRPYAVRTVATGADAVARQARWRSPLNHPTVMFRRADVLAVGGYEGAFDIEDYRLWAKLLAAGKRLDNLDRVLVRQRAGAALTGRRGGWRYARNEIELLRSFVELGFLTRRQAALGLLVRIPARLLPNNARAWLYRRVLRRNVDQIPG